MVPTVERFREALLMTDHASPMITRQVLRNLVDELKSKGIDVIEVSAIEEALNNTEPGDNEQQLH